MPFIHLTTFIAAPIERVFDLSRSINLHKASMKAYNERPIAGKISGLIEWGETVTWRAKHMHKERQLTIAVTSLQRPVSFVDEQVKGDFEMMKHEHHFKPCDNGTIMIDQFYFEIKYGVAGKWFNRFYLEKYLKQLLEERNRAIKKAAESELWKHYLSIV
ncbi:MAG: SRPBCC family protein [Flavisolibacter sp.]|nr:SRPBCC family protein [Flavisolibacter sp.]MBD0365443.1 SRPBCC family protein [Flavisolibacter sp.]